MEPEIPQNFSGEKTIGTEKRSPAHKHVYHFSVPALSEIGFSVRTSTARGGVFFF
jgi:hypothetical protein